MGEILKSKYLKKFGRFVLTKGLFSEELQEFDRKFLKEFPLEMRKCLKVKEDSFIAVGLERVKNEGWILKDDKEGDGTIRNKEIIDAIRSNNEALYDIRGALWDIREELSEIEFNLNTFSKYDLFWIKRDIAEIGEYFRRSNYDFNEKPSVKSKVSPNLFDNLINRIDLAPNSFESNGVIIEDSIDALREKIEKISDELDRD